MIFFYKLFSKRFDFLRKIPSKGKFFMIFFINFFLFYKKFTTR